MSAREAAVRRAPWVRRGSSRTHRMPGRLRRGRGRSPTSSPRGLADFPVRARGEHGSRATRRAPSRASELAPGQCSSLAPGQCSSDWPPSRFRWSPLTGRPSPDRSPVARAGPGADIEFREEPQDAGAGRRAAPPATRAASAGKARDGFQLPPASFRRVCHTVVGTMVHCPPLPLGKAVLPARAQHIVGKAQWDSVR